MTTPNGSRPRQVVVLSAGGADELDRYARSVREWADEHAGEHAGELAGVARTLQVGRDPLPHRMALVVSSIGELGERLRTGDGVVRGRADGEAAIPLDPGAVEPDDLARLWVEGAAVDWDAPHRGGTPPARLSLPTPPPVYRSYWIDPPAETGGQDGRVLTGREFYLRDHALGERKILPAVAALEFAVAGAAEAGHGRASAITHVMWARPVVVSDEPVAIRLRYAPVPGGLSYELRQDDGTADGALCSAGTLCFDPAEAPEPVDLAEIRDRCARSTDGAECYAEFTRLGGGYGPSLRALRSVRHRHGEALARVEVPAAADVPFGDFTLHPSLLDAMLQTALWTAEDPSGITDRSLPFSLSALEWFGALPERGHVHALALGDSQGGHDIALLDEDGRVVVRMRGAVTRSVAGSAALGEQEARTALLTERWRAEQAVPAGRRPAEVVVVGSRLAEAVRPTALGQGAFRSLLPGDPIDAVSGTEPLLVVWDGDAEPDSDPFRDVLGFFRAWARESDRRPVRVLYVHRPSGDVDDARHTALDGLARTIVQEQPGFLLSVITAEGADALGSLLAAEADGDHEFQVRYTGRRREVPSWEPVADSAAEPPVRADGTYLITGGGGAIGRLLLAHLGDRGRFVISGRSEPADLAVLRERGVRVHHLPADLSRPGAAAELVERVHREFGPLHGVLHLAGTTRDSFLVRKTDAEIAEVLGAKVRGAVELDRATADDPLDFFVTFSSMSGAAGTPGQGDYAYANRFLDAFARWRDDHGRPGRSLSLLWSLWAEGGIRVDADDAAQQRMSRQAGLRPMPTDAALAAFGGAFARAGDHLLVAYGDPGRIRDVLATGTRVPAPDPRPQTAVAVETGELRAAAEDLLRGVLAGVFDLASEEIEADAAFELYGIDSLLIMDLTRRLEEHFGSLPKTLFFEYQDLESLTGYFLDRHASRLAELLAGHAPASPDGAGDSLPPSAPHDRHEHRGSGDHGENRAEQITRPDQDGRDEREHRIRPDDRHGASRAPSPRRDSPEGAGEPIAIIGVAARFPGSPGLDGFWADLRAGRDLITEIPADRWDWRDYDDATEADRAAAYSRWGGFLDGIDEFDPLFFGISPREAEIIDPQERLFLQTAWHAVENAGYTRSDLRSGRTGVYVGAMYTLYQLYEGDDGRIAASSYAAISNRVSYTLGLTGPSLAVDTMCSSALSAIHLAVRDLRCGDAEVALAGGVNLHVHPYKYRFLGQGGFTSSDGRCRSFGDGGDGYVPGEGVGAVLLKPLSAAMRDGDHVHGLVLGSGVNHGGRTNGFTVPNPVAQGDLIGRALRESGIDPGTLGYLEAHGTGTALGDPVEIRGLSRAFGSAELPAGGLPIGSVKSNIGHLESASGMAGLCKVLLQMRHGELVPSIHAEPLNPNIDWNDAPFAVQREPAPWRRRGDLPLRAGISSFGAGGANAHLIIEEHREVPAARSATGPWLFPLSAKTPERLGVLAAELADHLADHPPRDAAGLADIAHTLAVGREECADRMVVLASSVAELVERLRAGSGEGVWQGTARGRPRRSHADGGDLAARALAWTEGAAVDWSGPESADRRRVPLPGYPFERMRCWITPEMWRPRPPAESAPHPLLDRIDPAASLDGLTYRSSFGPQHPLISDHRVGAVRLLPGAAVLEMALAAASEAGLESPRLRDVRWLRPVVVTDADREVRLRLLREDERIAFELCDESGDVLARGSIDSAGPVAGEVVDLDEVRRRCPDRHEGTALYADLAANELVYGPSLRGAEWIASGDGEALVRIVVPAAAKRFEGCALHPSALDSALHALGVLRDRTSGPAMAPFAVASVELLLPVTGHCYAHVRTAGPDRYDVVLADDGGRVLARVRDLALRPAPGTDRAPRGAIAGGAADEVPLDDLMYVPTWKPLPAMTRPAPATGEVWVLRGPEAAPLAAAVAAELGRPVVEIDPDEVDSAGERPLPAEIFVLSGSVDARADDLDSLETAQRRGVLALFRLVKLLLARGASGRDLRLTVVTEDVCAVPGGVVRSPFTAGLHGLTLSLAQELPNWRVVLADRDGRDEPRASATELVALAPGGPYALRGGVVHHRRLTPVPPSPGRAAIRGGGAYVILGGAGGIGMELADRLVRRHRAHVVLVGRSELDEQRRARIEEGGGLITYRRADAADPHALREVFDEVERTRGALHGVFHSTIVLRDQSLAMMPEEVFRASLEAKTRTSVAMRAALGARPLDFVAFFSSAVALSGSAGQSNYAAGSTFEDAYAHHLGATMNAEVRVLNWGYWGTVGIVADDDHRDRLARTGIFSIGPEEGLAALEHVLGHEDRQVLVMKADRAVLTAAGADFAGEGAEELVPELAQRRPVARLLTEDDTARIDRILLECLWSALRERGLPAPGEQRWTVESLASRLGVLDDRRRLFAELIRVLAAGGHLVDAGDGTFAAVHHDPATASRDPRAALVELCERTPALNHFDRLLLPCLENLVPVLRGEVRATDVMFPGGSTELVEGAYRGSPVVDRANELVTGAVLDHVGRAGRRVTIVEIGAGTGGTTAGLLPALAGAEVRYVYTDVSRAFLQHGRTRFAAQHPFVEFDVLDVSRDVSEQGFTPGTVDVVVAANVLHATEDLLFTLRQAKALLRPGGRLVLNEATLNVLTATLTFGLLDGWWLNRDEHLRLPGSPLLSGDGWCRALELAGFGRSRALPADEGLTQHVVVAETTGGSGADSPEAALDGPAAGPTAEPRIEPRPEPEALRAVAQEHVRGVFEEVLQVPKDRLWLDETYENFGVDSLTVPRITDRLASDVGELPATLLFEHPTIRELADRLLESHPDAIRALAPETARQEAAPPAAVPPAAAPRDGADSAARAEPPSSRAEVPLAQAGSAAAAGARRIAVVGVAGRYPMAADVSEFWQNLREGRDCVREVPADRWDWHQESEVDGNPVGRWGGFLDGIDEFDPRFFQMSLREAEYTDPQERLMLQTAWHALEDAGYPRARLRGRRVGVYIGVMYGHYQLFEDERGLAGGMGSASIANRVSYFFDFHGPSLAVDTMCSSSLTAVQLACQSLALGEIDHALVGGVNLAPHPRKYRQLAAGGFTSSDGRCRSFGEGGDGMVPGEGVGAVLLKPLADAERDGDRVLGVLLAAAVNHGGKTGGFAVPNPAAQGDLVAEALRDSGVDPATVSYLEAHGTGTALGDPTEIAGLARAFGSRPDAAPRIALGSAKSSIGHLESAAGMAALTKVLLQLRARELPPSLHADRLNPDIDWESAPFQVQRTLSPWTGPAPLRAGISAFGAGGSNAHLIVEEYPESAEPVVNERRPRLFPFSARDDDRLRELVRGISGVLTAAPGPDADLVADLADLAGVAPSQLDDSLDELGMDPTTMMRLPARLAERRGAVAETVRPGAVHLGMSLREVAAELAGTERPEDVDLDRLAHTLQTGREPMAHRLAVIAGSSAELVASLADFLAGRTAPNHHVGTAAVEPLRRALPTDPDLAEVARAWVRGEEFDWAGLHPVPPRPMSLPGYPFARTRCWIRAAAGASTPRPDGAAEPVATAPTRDRVLGLLAEISGYPVEELDPDGTFHEHGLDSLSLLKLADRTGAEFGVPIGPDQLLATSTVNALASWLAGEHGAGSPELRPGAADRPAPAAAAEEADRVGGLATGPGDAPRAGASVGQRCAPDRERSAEHPGAVDVPTAAGTTTAGGNSATPSTAGSADQAPRPDSVEHDPVVIVGMAGVLPASGDLRSFWANLAVGGDLISEIPADRWDWRDAYGDPAEQTGRTRITRAGFMPGIDRFDPLFFGISPREAKWMDPRQRLLLRTAWSAIEDAGIDPLSLAGSNTGLFVGVGPSEYAEQIQRSGVRTDAYASTGLTPSMLANRISYQLDLRGPSEPVDTACSSSLVALHRAAEALELGHCETVLAGGVGVLLSPGAFSSLEQAGMLSPDGVGRAFAADAAGYVRGEGVGMIVLTRRSRALADGIPIHAVLRGSAVNHGGRANSLTAPNPLAQAEVVVRAHEKAGIDPATVGFIETHGTGTVIGDPAEANGLRRAFAELYHRWGHPAPAEPHCALGALKNVIGHLEPAAGIAGVLRVLLSMRHGRLTGNPGIGELNPHLDLAGSPFHIPVSEQDWPRPADGVPRRAGVSSFGYGGVNAHVVLEEYVSEDESHPADDRPVVFALSARDPERLRAYARSFVDAAQDWAHDVAGTAHTLRTGRAELPERLAFVARDGAEALRHLRRYLAGDVTALHTGRVERGARPPAPGGPDPHEVASAWVRGARITWDGPAPRRRRLPTYPFAEDRYWFTDRGAGLSWYRADWRPQPAASVAEHADVALVLGELPLPGAVHVRQGPEFLERDPRSFEVRPDHAEDYVRLLRTLRERGVRVGRVVHLWTLAEPDFARRLTTGPEAMFLLVRAFAAVEPGALRRVHAIVPEDGALAEAWGGFDMSLRAVLPGLAFSVVRISGDVGAGRLCAEVTAEHVDAAMVRLGSADRAVRYLREADPEPVLPSPLREGGTYLITGGLGGLGAVLARTLLTRRGARLALTGRSAPEGERAAVLAELRELGEVEHFVADVADERRMAEVVAEVGARWGALHGVFHLAGTVSGTPLPDKDVAEFRSRLRERVEGPRVLDVVTAGEPLELFVLYSSIAGQLGDYGLVDYAVGARFLDGFAAEREQRRADGDCRGRTVSIDWPMWRSGGMHVDADDERRYLTGTGFSYLDSDAGVAALELALRTGWSQLAVLPGEPERMRELVAGTAVRERPAAPDAHDTGAPVVGADSVRAGRSEVGEPAEPGRTGTPPGPVVAAAPDGLGTSADGGAVRTSPAGNPPETATIASAVAAVRELVAGVVDVPAAALDADAGFGEYGLDSFGLQALAAEFAARHDIEVPTTTLFGANTIAKLGRHVAAEFPDVPTWGRTPRTGPVVTSPEHDGTPADGKSDPVAATGETGRPGASAAVTPVRPAGGDAAGRSALPAPEAEPIAVIGMSGRFPGSSGLESFWRDLERERDLITEVPGDRWDWREVSREYGGSARWGGFLDEVDRFDPLFFRISPLEAEVMDPQQRLFLEHTWSALEDAGRRPDRLAGRPVCVFAGVQFTDYESMVLRDGEVNAYTGTGLARTMLANRVSYLLDLRGPSESIDTACSSSLVALHRAVRSLRSGESELAIAGGVSLVLSPQTVVAGNQLGVLSPDGRCKALDAGADGYVKGEGVAVLVLKPLARAVEDGDRVHAVIRGSAVNHGGRASSLTAPNPLAQADLLVEAYRDAQVPIETVSCWELHGTGTKLGDPVEVEAVVDADRRLGAGRPAVGCGLGTVKSNIGHLEPAAGIAGVVKVILSMRHRTLPATLHVTELNPLIRVDGTRFEPVHRTRAWEPVDAAGTVVPRRAGISSFGFGGVNAHVVLEEPPAPDPGRTEEGPEVFLLSARDESALRRYVDSVVAFLDGTTASLASLAHTSQTGRTPMAVRLAVVADSVAGLRSELVAAASGDLRRATAPGAHDWLSEPEGRAYLARLAGEGRLDRLARLWESGADVDWPALRSGRPPLASLPTYPFARERHWLPGRAPEQAREDGDARLLARSWRPAEPVVRPSAPHGEFLVLAGENTLELAREAFGAEARVVSLAEADDADPETGIRLAREHAEVSGVLDLVDAAGGPDDPAPESWARIVLAQELIAARRTTGLWYLHVTGGTAEAGGSRLRGAVIGGLVRMLPAEYPSVLARTVDVDGLTVGGVRSLLATELAAPEPFTEVRVRGGERFVPEMRDVAGSGGTEWSEDLAGRTVLITGGTGALGRAVAGRLIERGADRLVLLGRTELPARDRWEAVLADPEADPEVTRRLRDLLELERPGVGITTLATPLDDPERLQEALAAVRREWGPITGLVHCAGLGVMDNPAFIAKQLGEIRAVLAPKVTGVQELFRACADEPLRFAVLFSSVAAAVPALGAGMSDYALANSFLDRFAEHQTVLGRQTMVRAVQWPSWRSDGMPEVHTPVYRELGLRTLDPEVGLDLLDRAMAASGEPVVLPCLVDPSRFDPQRLTAVVRRSRAAPERAAADAAAGPSNAPIPAEPAEQSTKDGRRARATAEPRTAPGSSTGPAAPGEDRAPGPDGAPAELEARLTEVFAAQLRLDVADVARDADFAELGVDSIMIAQLLTTLERELGVVAEPSALLEHPTIGLLAGHLRDQIPVGSAAPRRTATSTDAGGDGDGERPVSAQVSAEPRAVGAPAGTGAVADGIAVVGMACHLPGAPDHQTFWRNLLAGVDSIGEVPRGRWDIDRYHSPTPEPGRSVSRWGGFLDGIEDFDPEHFRLDPAGAAQIDPLVRQFLEVSAECLADAGLRPEDVAGSALGVFAGARSANFGSYHSGPGRDAISGMAQNFIAAHVSHFLDVHGPAVVIDSACSSSLVSVHLAAQSLRSGESDLALAGGVEILLDQVPFVGLSEAGALSPTGRCRTFDEGADGIVLGEGAGVLLLKRLPDALREGDPIHAVLEGSAVNNDGRTMGITTPNPRAQQRTIERAWRAAGVDADRIGYVEAHGTGTRIGDPMELKALTEAFRGSTAEVGFCGVGSVKTNIGHALSAAGIAGLLKVVLAVRHGQLPPTLHCPDLNRRFRFEESPLYPVREAREWAGRDGVRRGAVSSFGFGGTNAHMVVRQAPDGRVPARTSLPPVRYRRRRFWFTDGAAAASGAAATADDAGVAPAETGPRTNGARPGEPPAAPFFELQF